jgi:hypothetical protein
VSQSHGRIISTDTNFAWGDRKNSHRKTPHSTTSLHTTHLLLVPVFLAEVTGSLILVWVSLDIYLETDLLFLLSSSL